MKQFIALFLKGLAMGAANVIPGVSGGTIAFITGIYEELIDSLKSFDLQALRLLLSGKVKDFIAHTNLVFLIAIFIGIGVSIVSLAKLLEYLFCHYEMLTMAFFFGLIVASIYLVGKQVGKWSLVSIMMLIIGTTIAVGIGFLNPAQQNDGFIYLIVCGMVAICSMVLPGLSGSYVLLIMGNYLLVISAIGDFDLAIIVPVGIGVVIGLVGFSHLLSFIFKKYKDSTISLLTGFVLGSLYIIYPWKETIYETNTLGEFVDKHGEVINDVCHDGIVLGYTRYLPSMDSTTFMMLGLIALGIVCVVFIDKAGSKKNA